MHDPMTVVWDIPAIWRKKSQWEYRPTFATIWHVDPEKDGSDDSCGWFSPKLTKKQQEALGYIADDESREPWFLRFKGKQIDSPAEAEILLREAFMLVGMVLTRRFKVKAVTLPEASTWACEMLANPTDNFRSSLCFLPGYHSNCEEDRKEDRKYCAERFFYALARYILRERRPWYKQVRYHFWHWKIQIHPIQTFKRWAWSRCSKCGKRFSWGYSPVTNSWNSKGPRWFRGETDVFHSACDQPNMSTACIASDNVTVQ